MAVSVLVLLAAVCVGSCTREDDSRLTASRQSPVVPLDTGMVLIRTTADTFSLSVEIAETSDQTEIGLMDRDSLPAGEGMIFLFAEARDSGFWMFRTRIPLDIAYLDAAGTIVAMREMEPCGSPYPRDCVTYPPGMPYTAALEVSRGYFASRGITVGDRVTLRRSGGARPDVAGPSVEAR